MTQSRERALTLALTAATLAWVAHRALTPLVETDLFFHLALGDLIRATHRIPFRNLYSFTYPTYPDPDLAWGFQWWVSWLYARGGFPAIVVGKAALITIAAGLGFAIARRAGAGPVAAAASVVLALLAADQRLVERPHLATFVGLGAIGLVCVESERRPRLVWLAPALCVVWANWHAGVFLGPAVLALWLVGARRDRVATVAAGEALAVVAAAALATCATPSGLRLPSYLLWHTGLGSTRVVEEFRRADAWDDPWFFVMLALVVLGVLAQRRRVALRRLLPVLVLAPLAWRSVRFVAEWAFVAAPFVATATLAPLERAFARMRVVAIALATLVLVGDVAVERVRDPGSPGSSIDLADDVVPFAAIDFVTANGLRDRLYEDLDVGCYLLWQGWPRWRVFQDARLPAYPDEFHRALDETPLEPAAWDALLARYGVDAALIAYPDINMRSGSFDPEEWALLWRSDDALVFARRIPRFSSLIAAREIPLRVRFRWQGGSWVEPLGTPPARSPVEKAEWQRRLEALALP